jgi:hypothetical protein
MSNEIFVGFTESYTNVAPPLTVAVLLSQIQPEKLAEVSSTEMPPPVPALLNAKVQSTNAEGGTLSSTPFALVSPNNVKPPPRELDPSPAVLLRQMQPVKLAEILDPLSDVAPP